MTDAPATYHELEVKHPMWIPTAVFAAKRGSSIGAPRPDGINGSFNCQWFVLVDGRVRWQLVYHDKTAGKNTQVAKWVTDWLPDNRITKHHKPCTTAGRVVTIQTGARGDIARQVRVVIDALGLPVPVPVEVTR